MADDIIDIDGGGWLMWALPPHFTSPGHRRFAAAHAMFGERPVRVVVTEDPDGEHYGWISTDDPRPRMIYNHPTLFRMCFPYGVAAEERAGKGRSVRLRIEAAP
jgi:hypothetical protein